MNLKFYKCYSIPEWTDTSFYFIGISNKFNENDHAII